MPAINDTVRPGDVISSDLIARMIALLNAHDAQLASIGTGGSTSTNLLAGFDPPVSQNVGKTLRVFGTFDFPLPTNLISIAGIPISPTDFLSGSNNTQLVFAIPGSINVPANTTRQVTVSLSNSQGTGSLQYTLLPAVAGAPNPSISAVADVATSSTTLRSSNDAKITGLDFGSPADANLVRLIFNPGSGQTAFPPVAGSSLAINVGASSINASPQSSTVVFTLPAIDSSLIALPGGTAPATLEFTAPGANLPVLRTVTVRRMA